MVYAMWGRIVQGRVLSRDECKRRFKSDEENTHLYIKITIMKQSMKVGIGHRLHQIPVSFGSLLLSELSPLELEVALDNGLTELKKGSKPIDSSGNYVHSHGFHDTCRDARDSIPKETLLEHPQIFVGINTDGTYDVTYNNSLVQRIEQKLGEFEREGEFTPRDCFSVRVRECIRWTREQQVTLVEYLVEQQSEYIKNMNPMNLNSVSLREAAKATKLSISYVDRLARNLSIKLVQEELIFAKELITSGTIKRTQGVYLLRQLKQDANVYFQGEWRVSKGQLISLLDDRYGFRITDKSLNKYLRVMDM
jgi:hypothetical protein